MIYSEAHQKSKSKLYGSKNYFIWNYSKTLDAKSQNKEILIHKEIKVWMKCRHHNQAIMFFNYGHKHIKMGNKLFWRKMLCLLFKFLWNICISVPIITSCENISFMGLRCRYSVTLATSKLAVFHLVGIYF